MGVCFLHGNEYNPLNYRVQAYASDELLMADTPMDNTIGVVTDAEITGYVFDSESHTMEPGMVWFSTAEVSSRSFNALKGNILTIRPMGCKQYFDGGYKEKRAYIYTDGKWNPWWIPLFDFGWGVDFVAKACAMTSSGTGETPTARTLADGSIKYSQYGNYGGVIYAEDAVDLTDYNTLIFGGAMTGSSSSNGDYCGLYVWTATPTAPYTENVAKSLTTLNTTVQGDRYLDISDLKGEHYIGFGLYGSDSSFLLQKLRIETAKIAEPKEDAE